MNYKAVFVVVSITMSAAIIGLAMEVSKFRKDHEPQRDEVGEIQTVIDGLALKRIECEECSDEIKVTVHLYNENIEMFKFNGHYLYCGESIAIKRDGPGRYIVTVLTEGGKINKVLSWHDRRVARKMIQGVKSYYVQKELRGFQWSDK